MAHSLIGRTSSSVLVRATAVTIVVMSFFGIATGALPVRCWIGGACSNAVAQPGAVAITEAAPAPAKKALPAAVTAPTPALSTPVVVKAPPSLTHNDVLAGTFAQLKVELQPPNALEATPVQVATTAPAGKTVTNPETGLSRRVVRAVSVRPDGTPDLSPDLSGSVAEAYADQRRVAVIPPSPAVDAAARIAAGQMPLPQENRVAELAPATPPASGTAIVAGAGANVRATPSRNGGKVLFALKGGSSVTIVESRRGWVRIKDAEGRTGWIYGDGLTRS